MSQISRFLDTTIIEQLSHMQLTARSIVEGSALGQHRSPFKGASIEFRQHRFYVPGDEPRRLDWRVLARTDRPYVKEYDEETNLRCLILLDRSGSMGYGSEDRHKLATAAQLAAALSFLLIGQSESVGLALAGREIDEYFAPTSGTQQLSRMLDALERCTARGESGLVQAMHGVAERLDRRALVVVISDFYVPSDQVRMGLAHLRHDRHEVVALQVTDRDEEEFPFQNWVRFRGMEGEGGRLVEPALARQTYLQNYQRHQRQLHEAAVALQVQWHHCRTDRPIIEVLRQLVGGAAGPDTASRR